MIVHCPSRNPAIASLLIIAAVVFLWELRQDQITESAPLGGQVGPVVGTTEDQAWPPRSNAHARHYYSSPRGTATNPGTATRPLDLASALSANGPIRPGDVLWLKGGVYRGGFRSELTGKPGAFIVVAQYPGERAVLDGASAPNQPVLRVDGSYTVYWGFEVTNSNLQTPGGVRPAGVDIFGPYTKFINLVVHDTGNGFGLWTPALGAELYGSLIFQIGWEDADRGHGHSIYVQNDTPAKRIVDNILFDGHSFGIHAYTQAGQIDNLHLEGNITFNHGTQSRISGPKANILVGGWKVAKHPVLVSNYAYYPEGSTGRNAELGYIAGCADPAIADNYFAGGVPILLTRCAGVRMEGNTLIGSVEGSMPGRFPDNSYVAGRPRESKVFVRANRYQRGRAQIAIFNWERRTTIQIDLSKVGLRRGERFEIRDVRNFFGEPLASGIFAQPMIDLPLARMRSGDGAGAETNAGLAPEFGAAVVVPASEALTKGLPWAARP